MKLFENNGLPKPSLFFARPIHSNKNEYSIIRYENFVNIWNKMKVEAKKRILWLKKT